MTYYPFVFHPSTTVGAGFFLFIYLEWARQDADGSTLARRVGTFLVVGVLAFVPTVAYFLLQPGGLSGALEGSSWRLDMLVATGTLIASAALWVLWRRLDWGSIVPGAAVALAAVTLPYAALSPFWDISGHVILAVMPTFYLTLVDRAYWPALLIPILMIPNRVYLNAHTLAQTIAGFVVAAAITIGVYYLQTRRGTGRRVDATPVRESQ